MTILKLKTPFQLDFPTGRIEQREQKQLLERKDKVEGRSEQKALLLSRLAHRLNVFIELTMWVSSLTLYNKT